MKIRRHQLRSVIFVFVLCGFSQCDNESASETISRYSWKESPLSPNGLFTYGQFEIGDDGHLYVLGSNPQNGQRGIFKYERAGWTNIAEPKTDLLSNLEGFKILNDEVIFHVFNKLYRVNETSTQEILTSEVISGIETLQGKLIVVGKNIEILNKTYSVVEYDGTSFVPISNELVLGGISRVNDKLFLRGYRAFEYFGNFLKKINYNGYFLAVDAEESIYFNQSNNSDFSLAKKLTNGEIVGIGPPIHGLTSILQETEFYDNTVFLIGVDYEEEITSTYYLDSEKWVQIPTKELLYDVVIFDGMLLAFSLEGDILELTKK